MPICKNCDKVFRKTGTGRKAERLCPECWFKSKNKMPKKTQKHKKCENCGDPIPKETSPIFWKTLKICERCWKNKRTSVWRRPSESFLR